MSWYMQGGTDSDVAISTRVRLARNLAGFKFNLKTEDEIQKLEKKITYNLYAIGYGLKFFKLKDMDDITKMSLVEKNIISPEFVLNKNEIGSILINDEENICIMINEEDHIRLQVFSSGLDLENTLNLAIEIDQKLENILGYATNKKYGYLTTYPNNCGTGLKASVMLHVPSLLEAENINKILYTISNFELNVKGAFGKENKIEGDILQISNKRTLGITEKEIVENIKVITQKLIEQERKARKILAKANIDLEDKIYRSYGILTNCKKISQEETNKLLSNIKLGTDLGILQELTDAKIRKLYLYTKPANMQKKLGMQINKAERDIKRAEIIKEIIKEK